MRTIAVLFATQGGLGDVGKLAAVEALARDAPCHVAALSPPSEASATAGLAPNEVDVTYAGAREALAPGLGAVAARAARVDVTAADAGAQLRATLEGADAVIACLGNRQPFRERWIARGTALVLDAAKAQGVKRVVALNSFGIGDDFIEPKTGVVPRIWGALLNTLLVRAKRDLLEQERLIKKAAADDPDLDYLLIKPVGVTPELAPTQTWKVLTSSAQSSDEREPISFSIAKQDCATFMLREALEPSFHRAVVTLAGVPSSGGGDRA